MCVLCFLLCPFEKMPGLHPLRRAGNWIFTAARQKRIEWSGAKAIEGPWDLTRFRFLPVCLHGNSAVIAVQLIRHSVLACSTPRPLFLFGQFQASSSALAAQTINQNKFQLITLVNTHLNWVLRNINSKVLEVPLGMGPFDWHWVCLWGLINKTTQRKLSFKLFSPWVLF